MTHIITTSNEEVLKRLEYIADKRMKWLFKNQNKKRTNEYKGYKAQYDLCFDLLIQFDLKRKYSMKRFENVPT